MPPTTNYEIPRHGTGSDVLLAFLLEQISEGEAWLAAQRPAVEWDSVLDGIGPNHSNAAVEGLSNVGYDKVGRNARDIVSSLSDFRHDGEFKPRWDMGLYERAHILTKLDRNWYVETNAYDKHRANLQYAVALGTGYLYEIFDREDQEITMTAVPPQNVTFVQLPADHNIQKAYMVIIKEEVPINLARRRYHFHRDALVPDRDAPNWLMKGLRKLQRLMGGSPALRVAGNSRRNTGSFPTVDVFHAYTLDNAINDKPFEVTMGTHGTNWSYKVPYMGQALPTGKTLPGGLKETRSANENDCRLFPYRRYTLFTRTRVIYDGSSPWWHGEVPLARTRFNDWAWEALGRSLMAEPKTMQDGIVALMRYIEDSCAARLDPPYLYDEQAASEGFAKNFDPRMAGSRAAADLGSGRDLIKFPVPYQLYDVPTVIPDFIKQQEERIDKYMGTPDLVAAAKAKQVPGEGTLEKLIEMAGPLVKDMMRQLEAPLHSLGKWRASYFFQFYSKGKVIQVAGPGDDDTDDADVRPDDGPAAPQWKRESESFDQDKTHDEQYDPSKLFGVIEGETTDQWLERRRLMISEFKFVITESGVHEMNRMVNRLALLQLRKAGLPIDWWTIAKAFKLSNMGPEPEGTHNMMERWIAEQHMTRELQEELQAGQQGQGPGRPATNKKAPTIKKKDGGARSTVATS
jgi:hypothetical protein